MIRENINVFISKFSRILLEWNQTHLFEFDRLTTIDIPTDGAGILLSRMSRSFYSIDDFGMICFPTRFGGVSWLLCECKCPNFTLLIHHFVRFSEKIIGNILTTNNSGISPINTVESQ